MPLPLLAVGLGLQAGKGIYDAIAGGKQKRDAEEAARNAVRPEYDIQDEYFNNQTIAQNQAQSGLSASSKDYYGTQAERGLTYGVDAALRGGGSVNSIAQLYDTYNQSNQRLAVEDSRLQTDNIRALMAVNKDLAGQKTTKWAIDEYEPYKDTMKAATAGVAAGTNRQSNGINSLISTAGIASQAFGNAEQTVAAKTPTQPTAVNTTFASGDAKYIDAPITNVNQIDNSLYPFIDNVLKFSNNSMYA